jgi:hypothetical protein
LPFTVVSVLAADNRGTDLTTSVDVTVAISPPAGPGC